MQTRDQTVVDAAQLARIENVHRGFLYQHLYATSVLLSASSLKWTSVSIEHDEDVEIRTHETHSYIQVKKRTDSLTFSEIESAIDRFTDIRSLHSSGTRSGIAHLWIVCNSSIGPDLQKRLASPNWPVDVFIRTPDFCSGDPDEIPLPAHGIAESIGECSHLAEQVPHSTLIPETLVWKISAWVQLVASGTSGHHSVKSEQLPSLLEQLVVRLQQFPTAIQNYRPHEYEPPLNSNAHIRLLVGFSGSGKTSWAAEADLHQFGIPIYFDVSDLPSAAVASSLVRELAAQILPRDSDEKRAILLPGAIGVQALRLIDGFISSTRLDVRVFLDNAHRISTTDLVHVLESLPHAKINLLAQPWQGSSYLKSRFSISEEPLSGWSIRSIAEEAVRAGCFSSPNTSEKLRAITGGLPLFVRDTCRLAKEQYDGSVELCCRAIEKIATTQTTTQEIIATEVFRRIGPEAKQAAAILSMCTLPLRQSECLQMISEATQSNSQAIAKSLRELSDWGIVQHLRSGELRLHDIFVVFASTELERLEEKVKKRAREVLLARLLGGRTEGGVERFRLICRLLLDLSRIEELVEFSTSDAELISEYGLSEEIAKLIRIASSDRNLSPSNRFWALDTLAFWAIEDGNIREADRLLGEMSDEFNHFDAGPRSKAALAVKQLLLAGHRRNLSALKAAYKNCLELKLDKESSRIFRYNFAVGLRSCGHSAQAVAITELLISEYYEVLGIELQDVMFKNLPEIARSLGNIKPKVDDVKRLADCLDLQAHALLDVCRESHFARIHAHKFYVLSDALSSAVKVGQDFVDECLRVREDATGARQFIESALLPLVRERKLLDKLVPVSGQYAVVLAYCGEKEAAKRTLKEMKAFIVPDTHQAAEYHQQSELVEAISSGEVTLRRLNRVLGHPRKALSASEMRGVGRNSPCPCGSGMKFKKCHGA